MEKTRIIAPERGESYDSYNGRTSVRLFGGGYDTRLESTGGRHHPFRVDHFRSGGGGMNVSDGTVTMSNWPCQWQSENLNPTRHNDGNNVPNVDWLSTKLFALTRPDSTQIDITRYVGELRELPSMLRGIGDEFLKKGIPYSLGHLNLTYKFGWLPFFKDTLNLLDFQTTVKKRFDSLQKLRDNGSTIRKATLFRGSNFNSYVDSMDYWKMSVENQIDDTVWGYTIWKTTESYPKTDEELIAYARRTVYGMSGANLGVAAWNLMPWSWMIDWFSNVGTFLAANANSDEMVCTTANLMHKRQERAQAFSTGDRYAHHYGDVSPTFYNRTEKKRFPANPPTITAHVPILNEGHMGILGSLFATKRRRGL